MPKKTVKKTVKPVSKTSPVKKSDANASALPRAIIVLIAIIIFGSAMMMFLREMTSAMRTPDASLVTTYAECVSARGSRIQESYPAVCVTALGDQFVQPL